MDALRVVVGLVGHQNLRVVLFVKHRVDDDWHGGVKDVEKLVEKSVVE